MKMSKLLHFFLLISGTRESLEYFDECLLFLANTVPEIIIKPQLITNIENTKLSWHFIQEYCLEGLTYTN